jgi:hypothetical protein
MVVIVVVAAVMVYAWSTGLLGTLLVTPNNNKEVLTNDANTYSFNGCTSTTCTNVTINLRNAGSSSITLGSYYVTDSNGNQWALTSGWTSAPTIAPNQVIITKILIGSSCPTCTYTGAASGFANFQTSYTYNVKVITVKGNPFSFPVTR